MLFPLLCFLFPQRSLQINSRARVWLGEETRVVRGNRKKQKEKVYKVCLFLLPPQMEHQSSKLIKFCFLKYFNKWINVTNTGVSLFTSAWGELDSNENGGCTWVVIQTLNKSHAHRDSRWRGQQQHKPRISTRMIVTLKEPWEKVLKPGSTRDNPVGKYPPL